MIAPTYPQTGHPTPEDLSARQALAMDALLQGATQAEAGHAAGVTDRTVRLWLQEPAFGATLRQARGAVWSETTTLLHAASRDAVRTLQAVMNSDQSRPYERVVAARTILQLGARAAEIEDLGARITELEAQVA